MLRQTNLSARDAARIIGVSYLHLNRILNDVTSITTEHIVLLSSVLNFDAEEFASLVSRFQLAQVTQKMDPQLREISQLRKLYSIYPVSEMMGRRWISEAGRLSDLENELMQFMGIDDRQTLYNTKVRPSFGDR